ncbi:MAG: radical SAM protein [Pseudomonadota bacterium]
MNTLLIQLPIPQLNFGLKTGNIALGAACLKQAAAGLLDCHVDIVPENIASCASDNALIRYIAEQKPDVLGFTVFCWNLERSLYLAEQIKQLIRTRIIFGGPEITPDNMLIRSDAVDFYVYGEGEAMFTALLTSETLWEQRYGSKESAFCFLSQGSPYVNGYLTPATDTLMLLETQRGCPYRCGFCYYNKSRKTRSIADDQTVLDGILWARDNHIDEIYLLDPSLNARPGLTGLLKKIADVNKSGKIAFNSEIRAESVDRAMAELFQRAGFTGFEVGLQSTNPVALRQMNRPTDLTAFLNGVNHLRNVGISPTVDLIYGLPGDTLAGFKKTLAFVENNHLYEHIQVFPLLVLPGTQFRKNSQKLGLNYETKPPYTLISTPTFTPQDMLLALDMAEDLFDVTLCTFPDLEVSFKNKAGSDHYVDLNGRPHLSKLILHTLRRIETIESLSAQLASPYQVFFGPEINDIPYQNTVLRCLTQKNPFVPLEIIFIEPGSIPDTKQMLSAIAIQRPHFLDHDLRYLYQNPGNRAVQFTVIAKNTELFFLGEMRRQIYLWDKDVLPEKNDFNKLSHLDGIIIDSRLPHNIVHEWQDKVSCYHKDIMAINFIDINLQIRWMEQTDHERYNIPVLKTGEHT